MISHDLIAILACPLCKGELTPTSADGLLCPACDLTYPVRDGIPVMLPDEALKSTGNKAPVKSR